MEYKKLEANNLKPMETYKLKVKKIKQKNAIRNLFIFLVLTAIVSLSIGLAYYFYLPIKSETIKVFHNVKLEMNYQNHYDTKFNLKIKSKKFIIEHQFGFENNTDKTNNHHHHHHSDNDGYFTSFSNYIRRNVERIRSDNMFTLKKENDLNVKIKRVTPKANNSTVELDNKHHHSSSNGIQNNGVECFQVTATSLRKYRTADQPIACFNLSPYYWYGGHESYDEPYWPINNQTFDYKPYVTGYPDGWAAVVERYWLSTAGIALYVSQDVALHVQHVNQNDQNQICLMADVTVTPYKYTPMAYADNSLTYDLCTGPDMVTLHTYMINNYIGKPKSVPDLQMFMYPVWTTWSYYFSSVNQTLVEDFAQQIVAHNYPRSNLEIDDRWEIKYGDLDFDKTKFPDMKSLSQKLHSLGFRVTLWVHPFCNIDSINFVYGADNGYWVTAPDSSSPAFTNWWDGKYAAILDTTNPNATAYYVEKLNYLKNTYLVDAFKFDAGESAWTPRAFKFFDEKANPNVYSSNYVRMASLMGNFIEVRTGASNQDVGVFYRILDRATDWTIHDGIKSVVTQTMQFGLLGYPYVLPDIIFGNSGPDASKKELFIRWVQLTSFLPCMQFSTPPWYFDSETDTISSNSVVFHATAVYPYMIRLVAKMDGIPLIRPLWWANATDAVTYAIADQFIVGDEILVAPVLDQGITSRDIYLPSGNWFDPTTNKTINGPVWLNNYPVVLESIPYFLLNNGFVMNLDYFKSKF